MARVQVQTQKVTNYTLVPVYSAPTQDGDSIESGRVLLHVVNSGASDVTVTVLTPAETYGLAVSELTVTAPAGDRILIGPFPEPAFGRRPNQTDSGRVWVDYSSVTDLTRAVIAY